MILQQTLVIEKCPVDITDRLGPTTTGFSITMSRMVGWGNENSFYLPVCVLLFTRCAPEVYKLYVELTEP